MTDAELDQQIRDLVDYHLNLEDGEMVMPLKRGEIDSVRWAIRDLVNQAVKEATR